MTRQTFLKTLAGAAAGSTLAGCRTLAPASTAAPAAAVPEAAPSRKDQLLGRAFDHIIAAEVIGAVYVGDRLGLFKAMAGSGPLTADRLAAKTGTNTRYVLEWLRSMATSRYVDYHPQDGTFELPADFVPVLVDENSPEFVCGIVEGVYPDIAMIPRVLDAARTGRGIPYGDYPPETFEAIERSTKQDYLHRLVPEWLPAIPGITERLRAGGAAADLGSGSGWASIEIAKAFPAARTFGYEPYAPSVERARMNAADAKVADRVTFSTFDGVHVPGGPYDLVTINYSLHHAGDPAALMRSAREVLAPGGAFLVVEFRKSARLEDDIDSMRRVLYPIGLLECMPTALAEGGPGYGMGITEPDIRKLAEQAGFRDVRRVLPDDELKAFYVLRV